jgi:uncharacterized repeat protein (TIGR04052 family)
MNLRKTCWTLALCLAGSLAQAGQVALRFQAVVGEQPFACGQTYAGIGSTHSSIVPSDYRFYVSEVALLDAQGRAVPVELDQDGIWQYRNLALLDFEDGTGPCRNGNAGLRDVVTGQVPDGHYRGLRFTLGVPFELNHSDPTIAPSPLNLTSLFWAWQSGYRFVKIDMASSGQPQAGETRKDLSMREQVENMARIDQMKKAGTPPKRPPTKAAGFSIHLGSTECASASLTTPPEVCRNPNRATVAFEPFDAGKNVIVADLASLLAATDVDVNAENSAPGCMAAPDDADCPGIMAGFGLPFGGQPAAAQRFFRVR